METPTAGMELSLKRKSILRKALLRLGWIIALLVCEAAIFIFGAYYFDVFPTNKNLAYSMVLCALFLTSALWVRSD